ncbi:hypothetical protein V5799_032265 [Amblyomma americanum]|uniref:Uncharacterized protein n=1 Tax=Amblyomma americanum TaxID=6943 RepID=A0AAQ4DRP4_AMBAM
MSDSAQSWDSESWSRSYGEDSGSTSPSVETLPSTEESTTPSTGESRLQKRGSRTEKGVQPRTSKSVAWRHMPKSGHREKTKSGSQPVDDVANAIREDGYNLLTQSLARLVNSLSAAVDACCGPSQPLTTSPGDEADCRDDRSKRELTGDSATAADPGKTVPGVHALKNGTTTPGSATAGRSEQREDRDEQKSPAIPELENSKTMNTQASPEENDFLDLLASGQRSPLELLEAEIKANEALEAKLLRDEISHLTSEKYLQDLSEKEQCNVDAPNPSARNVSMQSEGETENFEAQFVRELPDDQEAEMVKAGSIADPTMDPSAASAPAGITRECGAVELEGSRENEGEDKAVGAEEAEGCEGKGEPVIEGPDGSDELENVLDEEQPDFDAPEDQQRAAVTGAGGDAPEGTAANDARDTVDHASLPADVIEKIGDLPREVSSAAASAGGREVVQSSSSTGNTELIFRYKTPVGLTVTLLFLAAVVVFSVTVGHVLYKGSSIEGEGTKALIFQDWNLSESSRALLIPEEETERGILTLDVN